MVRVGDVLVLAPRKANKMPVGFMPAGFSSEAHRPSVARFLEPEILSAKSSQGEERTPDADSLREVLTASPRDTPTEIETPKDQKW